MYTTCKSESSLVGLETIIILEALVFLLFNDFAFMCMLRAICTVSGYIHAQIARDMSLAETCLNKHIGQFTVQNMTGHMQLFGIRISQIVGNEAIVPKSY